MDDLQQKATAEAELVTSPHDLLGEGQSNGVMAEAIRGFGVGVHVQHLKRLDWLIDRARQKASANNILEEMEKYLGTMTANLNIIRPALMFGSMGRIDFYLRDW